MALKKKTKFFLDKNKKKKIDYRLYYRSTQ